MSEMSRDEKYEYWELVVTEFESSGKPIRDQCRANGIAFWKYYEWRKRIKRSTSEKTPEPSGFVEVELDTLESNSSSSDSGIVLECSGGFQIHLCNKFNESVLSSLLSVLGRV